MDWRLLLKACPSGGAQLAVDTAMVSPLRGGGSPHSGVVEGGGQAKQGTHISRAHGTKKLGQIGGTRFGSRRQVVP